MKSREVTLYLAKKGLLEIVSSIEGATVRDSDLLDSALHRPMTDVFGEEVYPTMHLKAAALMESLVRNHALVDGNKRLSWVSVNIFYAINGYAVEASDQEVYEFVIAIAEGKYDLDGIATQLSAWATETQYGHKELPAGDSRIVVVDNTTEQGINAVVDETSNASSDLSQRIKSPDKELDSMSNNSRMNSSINISEAIAALTQKFITTSGNKVEAVGFENDDNRWNGKNDDSGWGI